MPHSMLEMRTESINHNFSNNGQGERAKILSPWLKVNYGNVKIANKVKSAYEPSGPPGKYYATNEYLSIMDLPVSVDPVKPTFLTSG